MARLFLWLVVSAPSRHRRRDRDRNSRNPRGARSRTISGTERPARARFADDRHDRAAARNAGSVSAPNRRTGGLGRARAHASGRKRNRGRFRTERTGRAAGGIAARAPHARTLQAGVGRADGAQGSGAGVAAASGSAGKAGSGSGAGLQGEGSGGGSSAPPCGAVYFQPVSNPAPSTWRRPGSTSSTALR